MPIIQFHGYYGCRSQMLYNSYFLLFYFLFQVGELIGGSQREERCDVIERRYVVHATSINFLDLPSIFIVNVPFNLKSLNGKC